MGGYCSRDELTKLLSEAVDILYAVGKDSHSDAVEQSLVMLVLGRPLAALPPSGPARPKSDDAS